MNDLACQRPTCGHTEAVHVGNDIFLYECLTDGCECQRFLYFEPGRDYREVRPHFDGPAIHSDTCEIVDCPADHE